MNWFAYGSAREDEVVELVHEAVGFLVDRASNLHGKAAWPGGPLGLVLTLAATARLRKVPKGEEVLVSRLVASAFAQRPAARTAGLFGSLAGTVGVCRAVDGTFPTLHRIANRVQQEISPADVAVPGRPLRTMQYDLVSGAAGWAQLSGLVTLPPDVNARVRNAWERVSGPNDLSFLESEARADACMDGYGAGLNLGVAHGIAGVCAALPQIDLHSLADQLFERIDDELVCRGGVWGLPCASNGQAPFARGWCYGAAGVAAALAGRVALSPRRSQWELALRRVAQITCEQPGVSADALGFCHGSAGVMHCLALTTAIAGFDFERELAALLDRVITDLQELLLKPSIENLGFLSGLAGIPAILAASVERAPHTHWHSLVALPPFPP